MVIANAEMATACRALPTPPVGAPGPFDLADRSFTQHVLTDAGFVAVDFDEVTEAICAARATRRRARGTPAHRGLLDRSDPHRAGHRRAQGHARCGCSWARTAPGVRPRWPAAVARRGLRPRGRGRPSGDQAPRYDASRSSRSAPTCSGAGLLGHARGTHDSSAGVQVGIVRWRAAALSRCDGGLASSATLRLT